MSSSPLITFISDEYSASLDAAIAQALTQNLTHLELRSVNQINLMDLPLSDIEAIANQIHRHGLQVANFASPLLKWLPPGKIAFNQSVNWHGYTPDLTSLEATFHKAFTIADILQTPYIRIFSYLKYVDFQASDLNQDVTQLLQLAEHYDKILLLENEPVCNIDTLLKQSTLLTHWNHHRLQALIDIGNLYQLGLQSITHLEESLHLLAPYIQYIHVKDFCLEQQKFVPIGAGSINYPHYFNVLNEVLQGRQITYSVETHVPSHPQAATQESIHSLKEVLERVSLKT